MATANTDRNLLFGILALQLNFVSRDALIKAMNAWVLEKAKGLGQILVEHKALGIDRHALLEALVQEHLKQHGNDPERSLTAVSSVGSVRDELKQITDPDLQASLAHVSMPRPAGTDSWATSAPSVGTSTSSGLRFRILRPHAQGGLGQVFVAQDEELHREVALKEIQSRHADDLDSRSRFLLEAEITGGLEHPGIVPVYGLGSYADGRPFYAMRFIKGDSLKEAIERFHRAEKSGRDPGERAVELRKLLGRFLDVCNAIAYAHSRAVLHRDLKPGNIMLGQYGETLVVDWGLAKPLDRLEPVAGSGEMMLRPASASGSMPTQMGSAIGTPQFMSPEQAAGRLDRLGPASDVYSLGATLYCLLTGKAPFTDPDIGAVLHKVQRGDFPPPRQLQPQLPSALEAICLKAMALLPEDRYASARALANDLEHWLADEPVSAHREGWGPRLARWARRHRALVTGAAALLATAVVALAVSTVLIEGAREAEEEQRKQAETAREEAAARARAEEAARKNAEQAQYAEALAKEKETEQRRKAEAAHRAEAKARDEAETHLYLSNVASAHREWLANNAGRVEELLNECPFERRNWEWHYLKRQGRTSLLTFIAHQPATVSSVGFSPDGKRLASSGGVLNEPGNVLVWDVTTGQVYLTLGGFGGHSAEVTSVAFSPDGTQVVSASQDKTVRLWDSATGRQVRTLRGHSDAVTSVALSPNGKLLASASKDKTVKLWDVIAGKDLHTLRGHTDVVTCVAFSPDGKRLASGSALGDPSVRLWDTATGKETRKLGEQLLVGVTGVTFRPDGAHLASACRDGTVRVWDATTGQIVSTLAGQRLAIVTTVAYSPDGNRLAWAGHEQSVKVWDAHTYQEVFTLRGHDGWLTTVAFSPDSRRLASAGLDGMVKVWDATTAQDVATLIPKAKDSTCSAVAFSPDGKQVASASGDKMLHIWETTTGQPGLNLRGHADEITSLAFSPDGKRLASAGVKWTVKVWDATTGRELLTLQEPIGKAAGTLYDASALMFSPDGQRLAWAGKEGTVKVWDTATKTANREVVRFRSSHPLGFPGLGDGALALAFSADGRRFASGGPDGLVKVWDAITGKPIHTLYGTVALLTAVAFSPDGRYLASAVGGSNRSSDLKIWDLSVGREVLTFTGHAEPIFDLAFSLDGKRLASASWDKTVKLWDVSTGRELLLLRGHAILGRGLAFSPDGKHLASAGSDGLKIWDATPSREVLTLSKHPAGAAAVAFSPDGKRLASTSNRVVIWDGASGREILALPWEAFGAREPLLGNLSAPIGVAFSPDGKYVAAGGGNPLLKAGDLRVWDATTGQVQHTLREHQGSVTTVAFSPDSQRLASASLDKTVKIWNTTTGRTLLTLQGHTERVNGVAFSPDGQSLASAGRDKVVKIWDSTTGREIQTLSGHRHYIARVAFSPDGRGLASVGGNAQNGEAKVWDVTSGKEVLAFRGHTALVTGVAFSPDGRFVVSAGNDRTVRVWDATTGKELLVLRGHLDDINRVAVSPDGRFAASASMDRTVRVWDVTLGPTLSSQAATANPKDK